MGILGVQTMAHNVKYYGHWWGFHALDPSGVWAIPGLATLTA